MGRPVSRAGRGPWRLRQPRLPADLVALLTVLTMLLASVAVTGCGPTAAPNARWVAPDVGDDSGTISSAEPSAPPVPDDILAKIPKFPPAPAPAPITVPAGPSAAWLNHIPTTQPVAFLTIDDGWVQLPVAVRLMQAARVPVTLFLTINAIRANPDYFKGLQRLGAVIEAHTLTHPNMRGKPYEFQTHEACGSADQLGSLYGRRPVLFRPPFGEEDANTLRAVHDCGMKAAFHWKETVNEGVVRYQVGNKLQAGDIVLMHFRPAFAADFLAALQAIHDAGLTPALLEDYIT